MRQLANNDNYYKSQTLRSTDKNVILKNIQIINYIRKHENIHNDTLNIYL